MKTLYIECNMGAAGDMLMAALSELIPEPERFIERMNRLGLPGVHIERRADEKCGMRGSHIAVTVHGEEEHSHDVQDHEHHHEHHHHHSGLHDVRAIIDGLDLPEKVKRHAGEVYDLIAGAEARVHGTTVDQVHFHEVGALDAVADVVGVCLLMDMIAPDRVVVSPVHVGSGQVKCAHGILPVPAPATALLLEGAPIYGGQIRGELCTPTGAALLKHFADGFGPMPTMAVSRTGVGTGSKDFEWANVLRAMLGESVENQSAAPSVGSADASELRCNLDDMTGEAIAFAAQALLDAGALDVWCQTIFMKKGRPGTMLCCLCRAGEEEKYAALMLKHTTSIGIRWQRVGRFTLEREAVTLDSPWGPVRAKRSHGYGVNRVKPEFEDIAEIARHEAVSLEEVMARR